MGVGYKDIAGATVSKVFALESNDFVCRLCMSF